MPSTGVLATYPPISAIGPGRLPRSFTHIGLCFPALIVSVTGQGNFDLYMGATTHTQPLVLLFLRDLLQLGGELVRTSRAVQELGLGLSASLHRAESKAEAALGKQKLLQAQLEEQLQAKLLREKDLAQLQVQSDLDKADLSARWVGAARPQLSPL